MLTAPCLFYQNINFLFNLLLRVTLWICFSLLPSPCPPVIVYSILNRPNRIHSARQSTPHRRDATQWELDSCSKPTWSHVNTSIDGFCKVCASHSTTTTSPGIDWWKKTIAWGRWRKSIMTCLNAEHTFFLVLICVIFLTNWMKCETNESYKKMLFMCVIFLLSLFSSLVFHSLQKAEFSHFPIVSEREKAEQSKVEQGKNHLESFVFFVEKHCVWGGKSINSNMAMKWKVCFPNQSSEIK